MYAESEGDHRYNLAAEAMCKQEGFLKEKAQEYAELCILCDRQGLPIVTFEDFLNKIK